jgi:nicotinate-nucleotide pyrophosphorylase
MRDARLVRLGETIGDLSGKAQNLLGRERTVDNQLSKLKFLFTERRFPALFQRVR